MYVHVCMCMCVCVCVFFFFFFLGGGNVFIAQFGILQGLRHEEYCIVGVFEDPHINGVQV